MKYKLFASVCLLVLSVISFIPMAHAEAPTEPPKTSWTIQEVKDLVDYYADANGLSRQVLHRVISCESGYNYKAYNGKDRHKDSVGSLGVAQFAKSTFLAFSEKMGGNYTDPYNPDQALDVAAWAIKNGHGNHWSCYRK